LGQNRETGPLAYPPLAQGLRISAALSLYSGWGPPSVKHTCATLRYPGLAMTGGPVLSSLSSRNKHRVCRRPHRDRLVEHFPILATTEHQLGPTGTCARVYILRWMPPPPPHDRQTRPRVLKGRERVSEGWGVSHPVLEGKPNANHVRARINNSRTQQLHNWTSSHIAKIMT
jgi:hypothetical protein